jgi:hypothetical protein
MKGKINIRKLLKDKLKFCYLVLDFLSQLHRLFYCLPQTFQAFSTFLEIRIFGFQLVQLEFLNGAVGILE